LGGKVKAVLVATVVGIIAATVGAAVVPVAVVAVPGFATPPAGAVGVLEHEPTASKVTAASAAGLKRVIAATIPG